MLRVLTITTTTLACAALGTAPALADDDDEHEEDSAEDEEGGRFVLFSDECTGERETLETSPDSPPLDTEDPGTRGCNGWELDVATTGEFGDGQAWEAPRLELNYGIGDNVELTLELPYQLSRIGGMTTHGLGAAELGIKHRFYEDESRELGLAFYPQVELAVPGTALADEEDEIEIELPLLFSTRIAKTSTGALMFGGTAGYSMSTEEMGEGAISASIGLGLSVTPRLAIMAEGSTHQALGENEEGERDGHFKAGVGVVGAINSSLSWFGSVGQTFAASTDDGGHTSVSLGVRVLAGGP